MINTVKILLATHYMQTNYCDLLSQHQRPIGTAYILNSKHQLLWLVTSNAIWTPELQSLINYHFLK